MTVDVDIEFVKQITKQAGQMALDKSTNALHEFKLDNSYVTDADREIELFIEGELSKRYPDFAYLGEEYGLRGAPNAPTWTVDPIDGTTNFIFGLPLWCVSVGLVYENKPILGVIYIPVTDELFWAKEGEGAFCNGLPIKALDIIEQPRREDPLCLTSRANECFNVDPWVGVTRSLGSIATELCYVSRGSMIAIVGYVKTIWDVAAGFCIATEAGCEWLGTKGEQLDLWWMHNDPNGLTPFIGAPPNARKWIQSHLPK